jgi:hypothetical protein
VDHPTLFFSLLLLSLLFLLLFYSYDDLKPPVSPIPIPPVGQKSINITNVVPKPNTSDTETSAMGMKTGIIETKPAPEEVPFKRPLSPYVV